MVYPSNVRTYISPISTRQDPSIGLDRRLPFPWGSGAALEMVLAALRPWVRRASTESLDHRHSLLVEHREAWLRQSLLAPCPPRSLQSSFVSTGDYRGGAGISILIFMGSKDFFSKRSRSAQGNYGRDATGLRFTQKLSCRVFAAAALQRFLICSAGGSAAGMTSWFFSLFPISFLPFIRLFLCLYVCLSLSYSFVYLVAFLGSFFLCLFFFSCFFLFIYFHFLFLYLFVYFPSLFLSLFTYFPSLFLSLFIYFHCLFLSLYLFSFLISSSVYLLPFLISFSL